MKPALAAFRIGVFVLSGFFTMAVQTIILSFTKGPAAFVYPRLYHAFLCRVFGIRVIVEGAPETGADVAYIGNHVSYLDIPALGSILTGAFVAKKDIERWPFFGTMGKMQRTFYISRDPKDAEKETAAMLGRLAEPVPLIIFPEGTSSDGTRILPFKSSFFQIFLNRDVKIQPFTISVMTVDGAPAHPGPARDAYAWYGDMDLIPHLWAFAKGKGAVVKVVFQKPLLSRDYDNRKSLCAASFEHVAKGLDLSLLAA